MTDNVAEEAEDDAALEELNDELGKNAIGNDEEDLKEDEIEPSVEDSDATDIDTVTEEAYETDKIPKLNRAEVNIGKFAVTKVSFCS